MKEHSRDWRSEEWIVLHRDYENYEQFGLLLKALGVVVCLVSLQSSLHPLFSILLLLTLWLMEGIWKTFQARMGERILRIEKMFADLNEEKQAPFQFYSQWEMKRPGFLSLIKEYFFNSLRPTVVYPYIVLVFILLLSILF